MSGQAIVVVGAMVLLVACGRGASGKTGVAPLSVDTPALAGGHAITEKFIDTAADDAVLRAVTDELSERLGNSSAEYATLMTWNKARRSVYVAWQLDAEVSNGGFNQFYYNPSGKFYPLVPESLKYIGAPLLADLARRANRTYEEQLARIKKTKDGTLDGSSKSYEGNPLNEYDHAFYKLNKKESLEKIIVEFVRGHKSAFVEW
jgi:hypothetical protein